MNTALVGDLVKSVADPAYEVASPLQNDELVEVGANCVADLVCEVESLQPSNGPVEAVFNEAANWLYENPVAHLIQEIETLEQDEAILQVEQAVLRIDALKESVEKDCFELGGTLSKVKANGWSKTYEKVAQMHRKKADDLIRVYNAVTAANVDWSKVPHPGWTKMRYVARVIKAENAGHWLQIASEMSKSELEKKVQAEFAKAKGREEPGKRPKQKLAYAVDAAQREDIQLAIEKAKKQSGTKHDGLALQYICTHFMEGEVLTTQVAFCTEEKMIELLRVISRKIGRYSAHEAVEGAFDME